MARPARDDVGFFYDYGLLTTTRTLYIGEYPSVISGSDVGGGTDYRLADRVIKGLHVLEARGLDPITLIVNNPGGEEYVGLAIYDAIRMCRCQTIVHVYGHAMSMASWFIQAADDRLMAPCSTMMIHYGTWYFEGASRDFTQWSAENLRIMRLMESHYMERIKESNPGYKLSALRALLKTDSFLSASQAVAIGLADGLLPYPTEGDE